MGLEDVFGIHNTLISILNGIGFLIVYVGLKAAFVYGRRKDFGEESYGRDSKDRPHGNHDWVVEIFQFLLIGSFWIIVFFVRLSSWIYGWKIIFRALGWIKRKRSAK